MNNGFADRGDQFSNEEGYFDAVHGLIDLNDSFGGLLDPMIKKLVSSSMLQRLRRIRQLGYVSHYFCSAEHSRFSHALGTLHVMRQICDAIYNLTDSRTFAALKEYFPKEFEGDNEYCREQLTQHLLVAALLQDVGELPFNHATDHVFTPSRVLRDVVSGAVGVSVEGWESKDIFTIGFILEHRSTLEPLNLDLLVFLITGRHRFLISPKFDALWALRHLLDGAVDADRLDYVFRDTFHTMGDKGSPVPVIKSLAYYDSKGPVFKEPGPVLRFITARAFNWFNVFFSPQHRFRTLLLIRVLQGILDEEQVSNWFFPAPNAELSLEDFKELDDLSLNTKLLDLHQSELRRRLSRNSQIALDVLVNGSSDYQFYWIESDVISSNVAVKLRLPDSLFFASPALLVGWQRRVELDPAKA